MLWYLWSLWDVSYVLKKGSLVMVRWGGEYKGSERRLRYEY
jgi:hypothetical protein